MTKSLTGSIAPLIMTDRLKRLAYRAQRRGFKEADIIFQRFAEAHLAGFSPDEANEFERILDLHDHDILSWVMGRGGGSRRHSKLEPAGQGGPGAAACATHSALPAPPGSALAVLSGRTTTQR